MSLEESRAEAERIVAERCERRAGSSRDLTIASHERVAELIGERSERAAADGWLRGADRIAAYIDSPRTRVYALASARRIPVHRDGSALIARRSELDRWLLHGGGIRT